MAFYPNADQLYYLIPKHSQDEDMCVGVEDYNLGRPLQLQKINSSPKKPPRSSLALKQMVLHIG
jgi:hypothetical protein